VASLSLSPLVRRRFANVLAGGRMRQTRTDGIRPPGSKNVANWQTQFFFGRNHHRRVRLRRQLSLPTVANLVGKLANSMAVLVGAAHKDAQSPNLFSAVSDWRANNDERPRDP
jgi:hypothetical protein